jgi:hypothetical protein
VSAITLNGLFALWLFANGVIWGPNDYVGRIVITIPPLIAIIALTLGVSELEQLLYIETIDYAQRIS